MNFSENIYSKFDSREIIQYEDKDHQGIPWNSQNIDSREETRNKRMIFFNSNRGKHYSFMNQGDNTINNACPLFKFVMSHNIYSKESHRQLRNLVHCTSPENVYINTSLNKLCKYDPIRRKTEEIASPKFRTISFHVLGEDIVIGGFQGQLMMVDTSKNIKFVRTLSEDLSRSTNCVKLFMEQGTLRILACSNDKKVRIISPDIETPESTFELGFSVNYGSVSQDRKKIALCLDSPEDLVIDRNTGEVLHRLNGHVGNGFSADWDPSNEFYLATANEDETVMIWDIRQGSELTPLNILHSTAGFAYKVQYSRNGKYLAFSEINDFLNIFDKREFKERQVIDYFGSITGFTFSESCREDLRIFLGVADSTFHSLIELQENISNSINI